MFDSGKGLWRWSARSQDEAVGEGVALARLPLTPASQLAQPSTRAWVRTTTQAAAARHGGLWRLLTIGFLAVVGGVAVALGI